MRSYDDYLKTQQTESALLTAARQGDIGEIARQILAGAELNEKNHKGYSALMLATYNGHLDAAALLLEAGADVDDEDHGGNTVMMGAAFKGHLSIVKTLISHGANIDLKNFAGLTALDFARAFGRKDVAEYLGASDLSPVRSTLQRTRFFLSLSAFYLSSFFKKLSWRF